MTRSVPVEAPHSTRIPVSDDQREIWLACQLGTDASASYHLSDARQIQGALDRAALGYAIRELVDRHDALRITIAHDGNTQFIAHSRHQDLEVVTVGEDVGDAELERILCARIVEPFDLKSGPLLRSILFERGRGHSVLLLVTHHIVADGWSFGVLIRELCTLYSEAQRGVASSLQPAMQYRDFVLRSHQDDWIAREARAREYWLQVFRDPPPLLELPTDRPRPAVKTFRGGQHRTSLGHQFFAKLGHANRQHRCTLFEWMLASLMALLCRLTGQTDIVVGIPHAGQVSDDLIDFEGATRLVGHCASLLPIRIGDLETKSFTDLLLDVKQRLVESRTHQSFTFSKIAGQLNMPREVSRIPLVAVSLNLERVIAWDLDGLKTSRALTSKRCTFFDLTIDLQQDDRSLSLDTKFNSDIFEPSSVLRWVSHWKRLLEHTIESPDTPVTQLDLLSEEERELILQGWNRTVRHYSQENTLHGLFEDSVDRGPDREALVFADDAVTYLALEERANRISHYLDHMGAGPGQLVAVCLERSPDMVAVLLAILKSGSAYVPLDPAYPPDRLKYVLNDSAATILVTTDVVRKRLGEAPCLVLNLDHHSSAVALSPPTRLIKRATPADTAYVIYTSGSTGKPKGVQISHRSVVNFVRSMATRPGLGPDDVLLAITTISFDIAVLELFLPLYVGGKIVLAPKEMTVDPDALQESLLRYDVTVTQATPSTWLMLIESGWKGLPRLKVLCGGEPMSRDLAEQLLPRCGELWNMYGPTETTVWSTCHRVADADDIHVGTPIENTQAYILDEALQPLPVGVTGELMLGGAGLARGYLGKPQLTAAAFIQSPFDAEQRLYRTGDLAKFRDDGSIECLGRVDFQVKIRGFRVELGEIESVLAAQSGIEQVVAVAREDVPGDKRLVAFVKRGTNTRFDESVLRQVLRVVLPDYMVPSRIIALEALPLTPSGKVDRNALSSLPITAPATTLSSDDDLPRGQLEESLEAILKRLLRVERVGRHDNFFDIGGHSLVAVSYFNEIRRLHGVGLPLGALFRSGSIASLACAIESQRQTQRAASCVVPIQSTGEMPRFFCVHGAGGNVLFYKTLSETLGSDYPFYGLQARGLDGIGEPLISIEDMAKAYVEELRHIQPHGPYCVGGYCLGGTIAYEIARALEHAGENVALLALMDTYNFKNMTSSGRLFYLAQRSYFHMHNLFQTPFAQWPTYLRSKLQIAREGELDLLTRSLFEATDTTEESLHNRIHRLNFEAAMRYEPQPYRGIVTNFKPKRNYSAFSDPDMGWGDLALGGVRNVELDLNPHAMLTEPFVGRLAHELARQLSRVRSVGSVATL